MTDAVSNFERRVVSVCQDAVKQANNLAHALQACEGLFPTLAVSQFLKINRQRTQQWLAEAASDTHPSMSATKEGSSFVLSTWDFCKDRLKELSSVAWHSKSRVCLLGVPSLVQHLPVAVSERPHLLLDLRTPASGVPEGVLQLPCDIDALSGCEFDCAFDACFLDPPWYMESYLRWIDIAGSYCRDGGSIAFALLGRLTRPSATDDRERILAHCRARGLSPHLYENFVLYEPPSYERHMLARAGIPPVPWKRADLVLATCDRWVSSHCVEPPTKLRIFKQARLSGLTIDVVFDRYEHDAMKILLIGEGGYWMETPSHRVPGLKDCNVFTSNGARFISPRPIDLFANLVSLQRSGPTKIQDGMRRLGFPLDVLEECEDVNVPVF